MKLHHPNIVGLLEIIKHKGELCFIFEYMHRNVYELLKEEELDEERGDLTFKTMFNKPVDNLPESLTHLEFGDHFNQPVDNLPSGLTHLEYGNCFNQPVDNLPKSIKFINLQKASKQN